MKRKISSIAEIEKEQQKIKSTLYFTRSEFNKSIRNNKILFENYLEQKSLIPKTLIGLGVLAVQNISKQMQADHREPYAVTSQVFNYENLIPYILPLLVKVKTYFFEEKN